MYLHPNANIEASSEDCVETNKTAERRQRLIPLAFTNTTWGREYAANPNWEHENLDTPNAARPRARQGSRFGREVGDGHKHLPNTQSTDPDEKEDDIVTRVYGHDTTVAHDAKLSDSSDSNMDAHQRNQPETPITQKASTTTTIPKLFPRDERPYSVMTAWKSFRKLNLTSPISELDEEVNADMDHADHAADWAEDETGPWMQVLMCWSDFDEWRLHVLTRSFSSPGP